MFDTFLTFHSFGFSVRHIRAEFRKSFVNLFGHHCVTNKQTNHHQEVDLKLALLAKQRLLVSAKNYVRKTTTQNQSKCGVSKKLSKECDHSVIKSYQKNPVEESNLK